MMIFFFKNIDRVINSENNFFPLTKPSIIEYEKIVLKETIFLKPKKNIGICFYTENICSHMITENLRIEKLGKFLLIRN